MPTKLQIKNKCSIDCCQFEYKYHEIVKKYYDNFQDEFFIYEGKKYCVFHAPMEASKINNQEIKKANNGSIKRDKFLNVIYGIINYGIEATRSFQDEGPNRGFVDLSKVAFPFEIILTRYKPDDEKEDLKTLFDLQEYKIYLKKNDLIIPSLDFEGCEFFRKFEIKHDDEKANTLSIKIKGIYFKKSLFKSAVILEGVDFNDNNETFKNVDFSETKFIDCRIVSFINSKFDNLNFKNAIFDVVFGCIDFSNASVYRELDLSCDLNSCDDVKIFKARILLFNYIKLGHQENYNESLGLKNLIGRMICENRIFDCDTVFDYATFYQAPNFCNTKFNKRVFFRVCYFKESCFKGEDYENFRHLKIEMSRKNLYKEELLFWQLEQSHILNHKYSTKHDWLIKFKYLTRYYSKENRSFRKTIVFINDQSLCERFFSKLYDIICARGTNFFRIIYFMMILPLIAFPILYLPIFYFLAFLENAENIYYFDLIKNVKKSYYQSFLITFDPFHNPDKNKNDFTISLLLFVSYFQSIIQFIIYIIFGFMLRKRFRIDN